jgi:type III secretory pathway component EscV
MVIGILIGIGAVIFIIIAVVAILGFARKRRKRSMGSQESREEIQNRELGDAKRVTSAKVKSKLI